MDLCDDPECYNETCSRDDLEHPHVPDHIVIKIRTAMQTYEQPDKDRAAKEALEAGRALFTAHKPSDDDSSDEASVKGDAHKPSHPQVDVVEEAPAAKDKDEDEDHEDKDEGEGDGGEDESLTRHGEGACPAFIIRVSNLLDVKVPVEEGDKQSVVEDKAEDGPPPDTEPILCGICRKGMEMPCWFCVDCYKGSESGAIYPSLRRPRLTDPVSERKGKDYFVVCDDCEGKMLLSCVQCHEPYKQPSWHYGHREGIVPTPSDREMLIARAADNFMCNKCNAKRIEPPAVAKDKQHTYLHMLVRCKPEHDCTDEKSTEDRIAALEDKVTRIEGNLSKLEWMLGEVLAKLMEPRSS